MKKILLVIFVLALAIGGYFVYAYFQDLNTDTTKTNGYATQGECELATAQTCYYLKCESEDPLACAGKGWQPRPTF